MSSKPSTPKVPRGLRVLKKSTASSTDNNVQAERSALMKEIAQIEQWWHDPRWKGTTRPYSGTFMMACIRLYHLVDFSPLFLVDFIEQLPTWRRSVLPPRLVPLELCHPSVPTPTPLLASSTRSYHRSIPLVDILTRSVPWILSRWSKWLHVSVVCMEIV